MAHDVFISHSAKDKTIADAVCATLESEGIRCWIAPRDVMPGMEWGRSIIEAIEQARIMILVFTANANASPQIRREVERAVNHDVAILPFRVENILPDKSLEYFIGNVHWLDALTPPLEKHIERLAATVKALLMQMQPREERVAKQPVAPPKPAPPSPEAYQPEAAKGSGLPKPLRKADAADSELSEGPGAGIFADSSSGGAAAPARSWRVPVWAWGGAVVLALALAVFFAVRSGMGPGPAGSPRQAAQPAAGGASGGAPAGQGVSPAAGQPPRTSANPALARPPAAQGTGASAPAGAPVPRPAETSGGSSNAASATPMELFDEAANFIGQKRYAEAKPLAEQACSGGSADGCDDLGWLYDNGYGVAQDYARAASLYKQACDGGSAYGCVSLGELYEHGQGVAQDYAQAASLYQKACDGGDGYGCGNLGMLYQHGQGVAQDIPKARSLYQRACSGGYQFSCDRLKELRK